MTAGTAAPVTGVIGTGACDLARWLFASPGAAYASVFAFEALMFLLAARIAAGRVPAPRAGGSLSPTGVEAAR